MSAMNEPQFLRSSIRPCMADKVEILKLMTLLVEDSPPNDHMVPSYPYLFPFLSIES